MYTTINDNLSLLVISSGPNAVIDALEKCTFRSVSVIDPDEDRFFDLLHQKAHWADWLITYRCHRIIPSAILRMVKFAVNIHPALLPEYAGLNPWDAIARDNPSRIGVTIHKMTDEIDGGPILMQETMNTPGNINVARNMCDTMAADMILKLISSTYNGLLIFNADSTP